MAEPPNRKRRREVGMASFGAASFSSSSSPAALPPPPLPLPTLTSAPEEVPSASQGRKAACTATSASASADGMPSGTSSPWPSPAEATVVAIDQVRPSVREALESLHRSPGPIMQLEEYERDERGVRKKMQKKEQALAAAQMEIYGILGLFTVFEGVIFTAVAQSSILTCAHWWCPFFLSLAISCGTLVALRQHLNALAAVRRELVRLKADAEALFGFVEDIKRQGDAFPLACEPVQAPPFPKHASPFTMFLFEYVLTYDLAVTSTVVLLSLILMCSCPRILCHGCACKLP